MNRSHSTTKKPYRSLSTIGTTAFITLTVGASAFATELPAIPVTPNATKVLILPTEDQTGDSPAMEQEHVNFGNHRLEYEFITRQFQVEGPEMAIRIARANDIDVDDEDSRTKSVMRTMGKLSGADWVVSASVIDVENQKQRFDKRRAQAKVQLRIFDMKQDGWIADRFYEDHKDSNGFLGASVGTTGLFRAAIDTTLQRSTSNLLDPYRQTVKVTNEFDENDYLAGQTDWFTGDPTKTFEGLSDNSHVGTPDVSVTSPQGNAPDASAPGSPAATN